MSEWIEDVTLKRYYDDDPNGRRAKIWHFESYRELDDHPWYWQINNGGTVIEFGECKTRSNAVAAVQSAAKLRRWPTT